MTTSHRCKSCGQLFFWAETVAGNPMPIDATPSPDGNVLILGGKALVLRKGDPRRESHADQLRTSHFATCQYAKDYRKRHPVGERR